MRFCSSISDFFTAWWRHVVESYKRKSQFRNCYWLGLTFEVFFLCMSLSSRSRVKCWCWGFSTAATWVSTAIIELILIWFPQNGKYRWPHDQSNAMLYIDNNRFKEAFGSSRGWKTCWQTRHRSPSLRGAALSSPDDRTGTLAHFLFTLFHVLFDNCTDKNTTLICRDIIQLWSLFVVNKRKKKYWINTY